MNEILVLGGGPAGTLAAIHLRRLGFAVTVLWLGRPFDALEGLSPRVAEALRHAGCEMALSGIGPAVPRRATWNAARIEVNEEYLIDRAAFDAALREDARAAGAGIIEGRMVSSTRGRDSWLVSLRRRDGRLEAVTASFLVDARGRRAPRSGRTGLRGLPTLALSRFYTVGEAAPGSFVTGFADGWIWGACLDGGRAMVAAVLDGGRGAFGKTSAEAVFDQALASLEDAPDWLAGQAPPTGPVQVRDATPTLCDPLVEDRYLRAGDAACAVDPLSGQGLFEAVGSASAAAAVINTLLNKPGDADLARRFYEERQRSAFLRHARVGRDFYREEERWPERPFWARRRDWPDLEPAHGEPLSEPGRVERAPVIEDGFVTEQRVIVTPDHPRGVWRLDGIDLVSLLEMVREIPGPPNPEELAERCAGSPEKIEKALAWLQARRLMGESASPAP